MFNLLCKKFILDYENVKDSKVREKYGTVFSVFSILCNIVLVVIKLLISFITNSVAIKNDALNNLSDLGSNTATLIGFKISNKHPDADHPYGHGRVEYVSGMIVSFLILFMGFEALKDSIGKIIHPEQINSTPVAFLVLGVSIAIKYIMGLINNKAGKKIESETLLAAGQDSLNDCFVTLSTTICMMIYVIFHINIDAYVGAIVSLLVLKSGVEIFKNMLDLVIGIAPDKKLVKELEEVICSYPHVLGIHDLMLHDYGPNGKIMSLHAEVDKNNDILEIHDEIDNIEFFIRQKYNILTTIHMDPIVTDDEEVDEAKKIVMSAIKEVNPAYTMHDFRMVKGVTHTNLIFDVVLPAEETRKESDIYADIYKKVSSVNRTYMLVIQFDRSYV